jgi:uncharacterized protein
MKEKREFNYKISIGIIIIALFGLFSTQAVAASFDCKKAASWVEKTVCSNPELSKLDDEMAKAYHDALASLSPEGQKETKEYQKQWLKAISPCKARRKVKYFDNSAECLKVAYERRIRELQQILIKFPDRIFRNVYGMYLKTDDEDCPDEITKKEQTYQQIENPRNENEKFWNTFIFKKASDDFKIDKNQSCDDTYEVYDVFFSNKRSISLQQVYYHYAHGAAHGSQNTTSFCWLLDAKRKLQASDLFDDKTGWRAKLVALVYPKLKEELVANNVAFKIEPDDLMNIVTSADCWMILKDGLGIQFNEWSLGNRIDPILITLDWKTIDPYISKNGRSLIYD